MILFHLNNKKVLYGNSISNFSNIVECNLDDMDNDLLKIARLALNNYNISSRFIEILEFHTID